MFQSGNMQQRCIYVNQTLDLAYFSEVFWLYMACALNTCLCLDLILMIKYPFAKKEKFMTWYLVVSTVLSLLIAVRLRVEIVGKVFISSNILFLISYFVFCMAGVTSSIFAYKFFSRPGMSREVKSLVLKRHISCIVFFFVMNQYVMISCVQNLAFPKFDVNNTYWWTCGLKIMFYMQGYFMPFIRCTEPAFIQSFKD
jgi:hypothetical protein